MIRALSLLAFVLPLTAVSFARANERHFTYNYETGVLNPGDFEIEPQSTLRFGREDYYSRWENRFEFEFGVVENLQAALYWNFQSVAQDVIVEGEPDERVSESKFETISLEFKYKLSDPVADSLGTALYFESSLGPTQSELEAKFLFDKRVGAWLVGGNVIGELEWEFEEAGETEEEVGAALTLGAGYFFCDDFMLGLEMRNKNEIEDGELESSTLSAGPVLATSRGNWWLAWTVLPQVLAFKGASDDDFRDLSHAEAFETRVILGLEL
jgi:hypothetical protein